ncbi:three component ABC system middle component [uncultured Shewanella sp.]|uniref:three component ABC system middle component n=1 Tax=uncultured Shewanella sp. TaxID=173975 RepID=UPI002620BB2A|nr:three component ABC system middle component [uncultured Shewanella sp.]
MIFMDDQYSPEEINLYNPSYVGVVLYQAIREYQAKSPSGFHCGLTYIVVPMSISPRYSKILPVTVATPLAGWVSEHEGELIGFAGVVSAYADIVNSAIAFLLEHQAILMDDDGRYFLTEITFPQKPNYVVKDAKFKDSFLAAGLLGRWFSEASTVESVYAQLGIRP